MTSISIPNKPYYFADKANNKTRRYPTINLIKPRPHKTLAPGGHRVCGVNHSPSHSVGVHAPAVQLQSAVTSYSYSADSIVAGWCWFDNKSRYGADILGAGSVFWPISSSGWSQGRQNRVSGLLSGCKAVVKGGMDGEGDLLTLFLMIL